MRNKNSYLIALIFVMVLFAGIVNYCNISKEIKVVDKSFMKYDEFSEYDDLNYFGKVDDFEGIEVDESCEGQGYEYDCILGNFDPDKGIEVYGDDGTVDLVKEYVKQNKNNSLEIKESHKKWIYYAIVKYDDELFKIGTRFKSKTLLESDKDNLDNLFINLFDLIVFEVFIFDDLYPEEDFFFDAIFACKEILDEIISLRLDYDVCYENSLLTNLEKNANYVFDLAVDQALDGYYDPLTDAQLEFVKEDVQEIDFVFDSNDMGSKDVYRYLAEMSQACDDLLKYIKAIEK